MQLMLLGEREGGGQGRDKETGGLGRGINSGTPAAASHRGHLLANTDCSQY